MLWSNLKTSFPLNIHKSQDILACEENIIRTVRSLMMQYEILSPNNSSIRDYLFYF